MVFGKGKLQDEIFCLTEERDYFQSKFLEQVNEIAALKWRYHLGRDDESNVGSVVGRSSHNPLLTRTESH